MVITPVAAPPADIMVRVILSIMVHPLMPENPQAIFTMQGSRRTVHLTPAGMPTDPESARTTVRMPGSRTLAPVAA